MQHLITALQAMDSKARNNNAMRATTRGSTSKSTLTAKQRYFRRRAGRGRGSARLCESVDETQAFLVRVDEHGYAYTMDDDTYVGQIGDEGSSTTTPTKSFI